MVTKRERKKSSVRFYIGETRFNKVRSNAFSLTDCFFFFAHFVLRHDVRQLANQHLPNDKKIPGQTPEMTS